MKWSPISSTLISGKRDAVLVDTAITVDQNQKLVDWIAHSGKNLMAIYATHGHGDHFFGVNTIQKKFPKARFVATREVIAGNSAGQAAVFLAESTKHVYIVVRGSGLIDTMSKYLIRRIEETPNITVLAHTELVGLEGVDHLERVTVRNNQTGKTEEKNVAHVFVMTGANPNTAWLNGASCSTTRASLRQVPIFHPRN
jgi:ribonuclease BN (tRNA processing enzyme)